MPDPVLLSVAEVAELTRLGRSRLYDEIRSGRLRSVKVGRRRLISVGAVDQWLAALEDGATP